MVKTSSPAVSAGVPAASTPGPAGRMSGVTAGSDAAPPTLFWDEGALSCPLRAGSVWVLPQPLSVRVSASSRDRIAVFRFMLFLLFFRGYAIASWPILV